MSNASPTAANDLPLAQRLPLALDPATPPAQLAALGWNRNNGAIKRAVAANPNTPPGVLLHLASRYWAAFLENPVLPLLLLEDPGLPLRLPLTMLRALVRRPKVPALLLQTLARHADREVREGAKYHVSFPAELAATAPDSPAAPAAAWQTTLRATLTQLPAPPGTLAELLSTNSVPDWLLEAVASTRSPLVRTALFEASRREGASPALKATASMLRRAAGETRENRYHHDYGWGESVQRWRVGQGALTEAELTRLAGGNATWQLLAARAANLPPALVARLARSPHPRIVVAIARRPDLAPAVVLALASRGLPAVALALASSTAAPEAVLASLARHPTAEVRVRVARNRRTPPATLAVLATDADDNVRGYVASNRYCPAASLAALATDADPDVRQRVARNPACPPALFAQPLRHDASAKVRETLAKRPDLPHALHLQLMDDPDGKVAFAAQYNYRVPRHLLEFFNLYQHTPAAERPPTPAWGDGPGFGQRATGPRVVNSWGDEHRERRLYGHEKPPPTDEEMVEWAASPTDSLRQTLAFATRNPAVLELLVADPVDWVRRYVADNPATPVALLVRLAADATPEVRARVATKAPLATHAPALLHQLATEGNDKVAEGAAANEAADPALLDQLAHHPTEAVRVAVAGNPQAHPATLARLGQQPSDLLREKLLRNPATPVAVLVAHLASGATAVRHLLAGNAATPPDVLLQLAQENDDELTATLAYNKAAPLPVLRYLWEQQGPERKRNTSLASHPHADEALLMDIAADTEPHAMGYLLDHPAMTEALFGRLLARMTAPKAKTYLAYTHSKARPAWFYDLLLADNDPAVLEALAHQRETPETVLLALARRPPADKHSNSHLPMRLVSNNTVPLAVLETLVAQRAELDATEGDPWWYGQLAAHPNVSPALLRQVLAACLVGRHKHGYPGRESRFHRTWLALVRNPKLPTDLLPQFADHAAREVRQALLQRPDCPADLREQMRRTALQHNLEHGHSLLGRASALALASAEWLRHLFPKAGWVERLAMVENPQLPADLLALLAADAHRLVRAAAGQRQATGQVPDLLAPDLPPVA